MDRTEIAATVFALVERNLGADPSTLTEETRQSELGVDSILMVDLMLAAEEALDFTFSSMQLPRDPRIGDIVDMIERELSAH